MALLTVEHFVALDVAQIAHVADISEREVVVETSLACPVTNSLLDLLARSSVALGAASFLLKVVIGVLIFTCSLYFFQETLLLSLGSLVWRHCQVLWHSFSVIRCLWFLASVALLPAFEVVVLALAALPSTVRELEVAGRLGLLDWLLWDE